eukprot:TRINITY_DN52805_c0_g1_i1.p1 TRINITY_DN52805_c0_g1~~TRINITY_DN52805_c0_g1_i1.p1  ORF type:complete len:262 (+),score=31.34 TRINITY_DN52805_c0_g1_i1:70-855(+)
MAAAPEAQVMGNAEVVQVNVGGMDLFQNSKSVLVTQEFAAIECLGIEAKNRYRVSTGQGQPAFLYCMETSECCQRVCCPTCRKLTMNVHVGQDKTAPIALSMDMECHVPMVPWPVLLHPGAWCFTCPMIAIACASGPPTFVVREGTQMLGTVEDPLQPAFCCNIDSLIKNAKGEVIMQAGPVTMCSMGMICPCVGDVVIPITRNGTQVAVVTRKALDCGELCLKTNRIQVDFGSVSDPTERKLIFSCAMLLDLKYFETNQK